MLFCSIVFSQEYLEKHPENPEPGKCYAKCVTPDEFKEETVVIESVPSYNKLEVVPAVYKTVSDDIVLKPSSKKFINVPAVYKTIVDTVLLLKKQYEVARANQGAIDRGVALALQNGSAK